MKKNMIQVNQYNIEYVEAGKGNEKTIVFAHGLGANVEQWTKQIDYFSEDYHVISFSLPGHGESSKDEIDIQYSLKEYALTVIELFNKLDFSSCIWVGNSMGGVIGYEILKVAPEKIEMIITNGTTPELFMSKRTVKLICFFDKLLIKLMKFDGYIKFASKHSSKVKSVQEEICNIFKKASPKAIIDSHYMLGNYSYIDVINETSIPIAFIKAQYDKDINKYIMKIAEALQKNANVQFVEFRNVGHISNLEKPAEYNQIVEELINYQ
ncbi:MAG: 3-oxoadipate enol-lactonase 2 [Candidatus Izimaplasma bacterium HR2]|nr:MAG: 3-oxoadipate enol-lactonase 2 [Candidatus Izimaplasma bacterium HR2]